MRYAKQDLIRIIEMLRKLSMDISASIHCTEIAAESEIFTDDFHKIYQARWTRQKYLYLRLHSNIIARGYSIAPPILEIIKKVDELFRRSNPYMADTYKAIYAYIQALLDIIDYELSLDLNYKC